MTLGVHQVSPSVPKCRQVSPSVTNLGVFKAPRRARGAPKECHAGSMTLFWRPPGAPGCLEHPQVGDTSRHLATLGDTWPVPPRATGRKLSAKADGSHPSAFLAARRNIYIYIYILYAAKCCQKTRPGPRRGNRPSPRDRQKIARELNGMPYRSVPVRFFAGRGGRDGTGGPISAS